MQLAFGFMFHKLNFESILIVLCFAITFSLTGYRSIVTPFWTCCGVFRHFCNSFQSTNLHFFSIEWRDEHITRLIWRRLHFSTVIVIYTVNNQCISINLAKIIPTYFTPFKHMFLLPEAIYQVNIYVPTSLYKFGLTRVYFATVKIYAAAGCGKGVPWLFRIRNLRFYSASRRNPCRGLFRTPAGAQFVKNIKY